MSSNCNSGEHFHTKARLLKSDPALNSDIYDDVTNTVSHFTIAQCLMCVTTRCCSIIAFKQLHFSFRDGLQFALVHAS